LDFLTNPVVPNNSARKRARDFAIYVLFFDFAFEKHRNIVNYSTKEVCCQILFFCKCIFCRDCIYGLFGHTTSSNDAYSTVIFLKAWRYAVQSEDIVTSLLAIQSDSANFKFLSCLKLSSFMAAN
jgi:hypothetical protein